jgi:hypothetical protein
MPLSTSTDLQFECQQFKFLSVYITEDLTRTNNTTTLVKRVQQQLYFLRRLKKFGLPPRVLSKYYHCTIKSWLHHWLHHSLVRELLLRRVMKMAQYITGIVLPPIQYIYSKRCLTKMPVEGLQYPTHPSHYIGACGLIPTVSETVSI